VSLTVALASVAGFALQLQIANTNNKEGRFAHFIIISSCTTNAKVLPLHG
jgi:hypothetical protein